MAKHLSSTVDAPIPVDAPIFGVPIEVTDDNGVHLTETVEVTLSDFALDDLRVLAYWEEVDPEAYNLFASGEIAVADFGTSARRLQAFIFALARGKVSDSRIRNAMTLSDVTMSMSEIQAMTRILEDVSADSLTS